MTDLPQLQNALVVAARRRNRLARARSALVGLAALAAVLVAAVSALDVRDRELEVSAPPAPSPSSVLTPRAAADRFAVLRDESRLTKQSSGFDAGPGSQTYRIRLQGSLFYYLTVGERMCASVVGKGGFGGGCLDRKEIKSFAEGRLGVEGDSDLIYALVPDGTRDASITYRDGTTESVPIKDNLLKVVPSKPPAKVSWTTPDGERFTSRP
jgi:hypothetical protein